MRTLLTSMIIVLNFASELHAVEEAISLHHCPKDIASEILRQTSMAQVLASGSEVSFETSIGNLRLVCEGWQIIIDEEINSHKEESSWAKKGQYYFIDNIVRAYETIGYGAICETFLNGTLKYTPNQGEPIILPIANLEKPFSGEFNLSTCEDADKYLSIRTGYRKGKIDGNENKVEIWFTPWFITNREPNTTSHLVSLLSEWNSSVAPIGIFWNWGNWNSLIYFEHLTSEPIDSLSSYNLLKLYEEGSTHKYLRRLYHRSHCLRPGNMCTRIECHTISRFHVYFNL